LRAQGQLGEVEREGRFGECGANCRDDLGPTDAERPGDDAEREYGVGCLFRGDRFQCIAYVAVGREGGGGRSHVRSKCLFETALAGRGRREVGELHVERDRRLERERPRRNSRSAQVARQPPAELRMADFVEGRSVCVANQLVRGAKRHQLQSQPRKRSNGRVLRGAGIRPGSGPARVEVVRCGDGSQQRRAPRGAVFVIGPADDALLALIVIGDLDQVAARGDGGPVVSDDGLERSGALDAGYFEIVSAETGEPDVFLAQVIPTVAALEECEWRRPLAPGTWPEATAC
jgi:hypothetical protein